MSFMLAMIDAIEKKLHADSDTADHLLMVTRSNLVHFEIDLNIKKVEIDEVRCVSIFCIKFFFLHHGYKTQFYHL